MKKLVIFFFSLFILTTYLDAKLISPKKVLYVNSYHSGYFWSDGIEKSIRNTLTKSDIPIELKTFYMDSKRNNSEEYKISIAIDAKKMVDSFKPDVIIFSDDNAAKYVILPHLKESKIPIVFCGINGSSEKYQFSKETTTGIEEVQLVSQLVKILEKYSNGKKVGLLYDNTLSNKKGSRFIESQLNQNIDIRLVNSIDEWKSNFLSLQSSVDILLVGNSSSLKNWELELDSLKDFVVLNTVIPTATWHEKLSKHALLTLTIKPEEHGNWAANTALKILKGTKPKDIPVTTNKESNMIINTTLAKKLNILFSFDLIDYAKLVK